MYPVRNCTRHSAMVHSDKVHDHHLTQSVRTDIQPHPATAVTPSNTSWFTSTFNLIQPQLSLHQTHPGSRQHSTSDSVHIQPHPATAVILLHTSQTQSMLTFNPIHTQAVTAHIHRQHTSKFNNLHTQVVTPSGTSTGSPCSQHTIKSHNRPNLCTGRKKKKVPRNHIITLGIPPKSTTQPYYHFWNTQAKHSVQCKSTTLCVPHRAVPKAHQ